MTTEGENGNGAEGVFKPTGTVALAAAFVVLMLVLWGSVYVILLLRGATV
jgi:hypothetical protein